VLDTRSRRFTYANAGHTPPLLLRDQQVCFLSTGGGLIGIDPEAAWSHDSFLLKCGDVVFAFTDGLHEALNFRDEPFGRRRVEAAALAAVKDGCSATRIVNHALWEMRRFAGLQTRFDDTTIVAFKVL
jgi:sigma-B regulation protein RsbU (phosphoserine phosphatase)